MKDDIVMVSFSGFGATGPYSDFRAIGSTVELQGGRDSLLVYAEGPLIQFGAMFADAITGLQMASMAMTALEYRDHYTSRYFAQNIISSGRLRPGASGCIWLTSDNCASGAEAANRLAIQGKAV